MLLAHPLLKACTLPSGKHQASCNTTELRWSLSFQVTSNINYHIETDEIKWQIRRPSRYARGTPKLTYINKVEEETMRFLNERIKHNFLDPAKGLSLDILYRDAEILISASENVRNLAETGELAKVQQ